MPRPLLAVLIPVFNAQRALERSLASLCLDGARFDVVIVDDGSEPPVMIPSGLPYAVTLIRLDDNAGIRSALNAGLARIVALGYGYVARLDAGDLSLPGRLAAQMAFLDAHPDHAVVGAAVRHVDTGGQFLFDYRPPIQNRHVTRYQRYRYALVHPAIMLRVEPLRAMGFYSGEFPGAEDYELYLRLATRYKLANLASVFVIKEINPASITSQRNLMLRSRIRVLLRYFDPWLPHAYLGIGSNLLLLLVPRSVVMSLRRCYARWRTVERGRSPRGVRLGS